MEQNSDTPAQNGTPDHQKARSVQRCNQKAAAVAHSPPSHEFSTWQPGNPLPPLEKVTCRTATSTLQGRTNTTVPTGTLAGRNRHAFQLLEPLTRAVFIPHVQLRLVFDCFYIRLDAVYFPSKYPLFADYHLQRYRPSRSRLLWSLSAFPYLFLLLVIRFSALHHICHNPG